MHDGIAFEEAGKPATTVITESFVPLARAKGAALGLAEYEYVVVPHPLGGEAQARVKAGRAARRVAKLLAGR